MLRLLFVLILSIGSIASAEMPTIEITQRTTEPLLKAEKPWEDFTIGYCNVIRDGARWRMWYAAYDHHYRNDADGILCYAESADGVTWTKPELGLIEYDGNTRNNIVFASGDNGARVHGACVFLDSAARAGEHYKIVYCKLVNKRWLIFGGASPDGIHWALFDQPLLDRNSDTQQTCFRDGDIYRLYLRQWAGGDFHGDRFVSYSHSNMFGVFSDPVEVLRGGEDDPKDLQFYNSAVAKLRDDLYVMFPSAFYTKEDVVRVHAAFSCDGEHFERVGRTPILELGTGFDRMTMYVGPGAVAGDKPNEFWFYYFAGNVGHDQSRPNKLQFGGGIGRFLVTVKP
jgi:hypothetical protein